MIGGRVTIRCPQCSRRKRAIASPTDPEGTSLVLILCDRCDDGGGFPEVSYFDAEGRELAVE